MKSSLLICTFFTIASSCFAQGDCNKDNPLFKFDNTESPKEVRVLGSNPEFPFLRNLSTPQQVLSAIKRSHGKRGSTELNDMLTQIGFDNGISDVHLSSISSTYLPKGTTGNMGNGSYNTSYSVLSGSRDYKAWKITSDKGCYVYFMAKCGNAFAANTPTATNKTACISAPVNITADPKTINTGTTAASQRLTEKKVYVYYHKRGRRRGVSYVSGDIPDSNPSHPLLLRATAKTDFVPQEYKVTVTSPTDNVLVCPDKTLDVAANINVEYSSEYTGNYPDNNTTEYKKVSKHTYKMAMRKMRKAKRKEEKIARRTHVDAEIDVNRPA